MKESQQTHNADSHVEQESGETVNWGICYPIEKGNMVIWRKKHWKIRKRMPPWCLSVNEP